MPPGPPARRRRSASLRRLLLSIAVISGAVYAAFWTSWTWDHHQEERRRAETVVQRNLDRATLGFVGFLKARTAAAAEAAAAVDPGAPGGPACPLPSIPVSPGDAPIERYDLVRPDGSLVCTTAGATSGPVPSALGAPWLATDYRPGSPSDDYVDPATGLSAWGVAFPVGSGADAAVLAAVVQLAPASDQLGGLFGDGLGTAYVVSDAETGAILSRPAGTSWTAERPGGHIVFSRRIPGTDWQLSAGVDRSVAYAETWDEVKGGAVRIASEPGRGTTVRLLLPASDEPSSTTAYDTTREPALGSGEVVLVVEDDDPLRALVERMLRAGNYTAVGAADPAAALVLAADPDQRLDVVLSDLLMPGMSGADLAARLGDKRPGVPVIYMSAYTADILEELLEAGSSPVVLEKPFTQRQLLEAVDEALSRSSAASGR